MKIKYLYPRPQEEDAWVLAGLDEAGHKVYWCGNNCRTPHGYVGVTIPVQEDHEMDW